MIHSKAWLLTLLVSVALMGCSSPQTQTDPLVELDIGDRPPALQAATLIQGQDASSWAPGQVYVVDFWAPWCQPCHVAIPELAAMQERYGGAVRVVGVSIMPKPGMKPVDAFVRDHPQLRYTILSDVDGAVENGLWARLRRPSLPGAIVVDGGGRIAWMGNPHPLADLDDLKRTVASLVNETP